jgi:hypothetical protein
MGETADQPGALGVLLSVPLGLVAAVYLLAFFKIDVDDRGEALPISGGNGFRGLYLATREALTGKDVAVGRELGTSAVGPFWLVMVIVPLLVVLAVFFVFRFRRAQSMYWTVTIGMLLIAASVLLLGRIEYVGSMAALTWASFQIRKAELPGKMADREAARAAAAEARAAEPDEDDDEYDDEEYDEYEDEEYDEDDDELEDEDVEDESEEDADELEGAEAELEDADDGSEESEDDDAEYEEEAYDEDVEEDDDVEDEDEDDEAVAVDEDDEPEPEPEPVIEPEPEPVVAPAPAPAPSSANDDDERSLVDYDQDILKELEAEIDESEGGGAKPGAR